MKFRLLSDTDLKAIEALKQHHGGGAVIDETIRGMRDLDTRKEALGEKGYGDMIADAEQLVTRFAKVGDFERANDVGKTSLRVFSVNH